MTLITLFAAVALGLGLAAARAWRLPPTLPRRIFALTSAVAALVLVVLIPILGPGARVSEAAARAEVDRQQLDAEVRRIQALSQALGGPQAYIAYLKATKEG